MGSHNKIRCLPLPPLPWQAFDVKYRAALCPMANSWHDKGFIRRVKRIGSPSRRFSIAAKNNLKQKKFTTKVIQFLNAPPRKKLKGKTPRRNPSASRVTSRTFLKNRLQLRRRGHEQRYARHGDVMFAPSPTFAGAVCIIRHELAYVLCFDEKKTENVTPLVSGRLHGECIFRRVS